MKMWNLVEGRLAFTRRLKGAAEQVAWSADGAYYLLTARNYVKVYTAADNECAVELNSTTRVCQAAFCYATSETDAEPLVCVASDNKRIHVYSIQGALVSEVQLPAEFGRARCMRFQGNKQGQGKVYLLVGTSLGVLMTFGSRLFAAGATYESALVSSFCIEAEPRLISLTSWSSQPPAALASSSNSNSSSSRSSSSTSRSSSDEKQVGGRSGDTSHTDNETQELSRAGHKKHKKHKKRVLGLKTDSETQNESISNSNSKSKKAKKNLRST
jgi:hypothetical protein